MPEGLGMQNKQTNKHRQIQDILGITSQLAGGKRILMSASVSARPPGRAGDTVGPRAHFSVAKGNRMRLDRFQAWDLQENLQPLPSPPYVPFPALDVPSPHSPSPP